MAENTTENESVTLFREYLRIPSVQPNVNYSDSVKFFKGQAEKLGLPIKVHYMSPNTPIVVITLSGKQPELPSVLLSSHMDVVPVYPKCWKHDPFSAYKDETGNIYARGAQDMKCVSIQYIETIKKYLQEKLNFKRTIHLCFTPDEETGSLFGIRKFIKTSEFAEMNIGFVLDEGKATPNEVFNVFYGERTIWGLTITCTGTTGHGSILYESTAGEKLQYIINKFMNWREREKTRLRNTNLEPGDVTSVNLTKINGGCQFNVLPPEISVSFDIRLAVEEDPKEMEEVVKSWCIEAGEGVSVEFKKDPIRVPPTKICDNNLWWAAFKRECNNMKLKINPCIFTGATDSRFIRNVGIPALGFSPMNHTTPLAHDHNEFLNENIFIKGLDIYYNIIKALASV
ncbi:aminoacylase-1-like [Adelges cooleyi]|uniref:aminoacylase-1-like n=1 Tax=Adelges cooleyi TaxID=133065 RepID=UPI00218075AB|nr:aminoacylase-1-like [Adelges cooleyi]XP_050435770.1 aminoacylase-1-like [Adelges cooleyi]XP_050435771.1 aminoacylase-1-like [Adelges cooleyi]XP_050435773.1 aminoacylase-1-like [Adelges cooleyi]XP_050435774.1 aminoacylase-1-like [Adelges cooleyi]XP_050435775.1 aminoacylase-1-like [Adelges cooleyi]